MQAIHDKNTADAAELQRVSMTSSNLRSLTYLHDNDFLLNSNYICHEKHNNRFIVFYFDARSGIARIRYHFSPTN